MQHNINNTNKKQLFSITQLNRNETNHVYGGFGPTARHFTSAAAGWAILISMYGFPTLGFTATAISIPAIFAIVDITDTLSFGSAAGNFAKKFNFGALSCLTLGGVLKQIPINIHVTTNVFTGFNITNEK